MWGRAENDLWAILKINPGSNPGVNPGVKQSLEGGSGADDDSDWGDYTCHPSGERSPEAPSRAEKGLVAQLVRAHP